MLASLGLFSDPAFSNRGEITYSPPVNTLVEKADFINLFTYLVEIYWYVQRTGFSTK